MGSTRAGHSATTLLDGKVLLVGGASDNGELASAEIFDSTSNTIVECSAAQPKRSVTIGGVTPPFHHTQSQSCEA